VATLVARGVSPSEVFTAVADEVANALRVENCVLVRYLGDDFCDWSLPRQGAVGESQSARCFHWKVTTWRRWCFRTGATARMDSHRTRPARSPKRSATFGIRSAVGAPIEVTATVGGGGHSLLRAGTATGHTDARLADFAELVATAIANAQARDELMASRSRIVTAR